ncbi:MAG: hypothetical protein IPK19_07265 [Chloroflexi bacterium]|nr:hypothetical protein [Chloroflexota bacterium]
MTITLQVSAKSAGAKKPLFSGWRVPFPPQDGSGRTTLRDLITRIVLTEVQAFRERQEERRLERILTRVQIEQSAERGKVDPANHEDVSDVNEEDAVSVALVAFEDGLYFVFIDDEQAASLDQTVVVNDDTQVMFVRLVALAGG